MIRVTPGVRMGDGEHLVAGRLDALIQALNGLGVGVLVQDESLRVTHTNTAFVSMIGIGVPPRRLVGASLPAGPAQYAHAYAEPANAQRLAEDLLRAGRPSSRQTQALADGRLVDHDYAPITVDGDTTGHLWLLREASDHDAADPDDTLAEVATLKTEMATLRAEFVAAVAHELRTPATSVAAFTDLLDDDVDSAERHRAACAIRRNAERMLQFTADLVRLSDLETGVARLDEDEVDLTALLRRVRERVGGPVGLDLVDGPPLLGDPVAIEEAVITIIAVAHRAGGAEATPCRLQARPQPPGWLITLRTPDTGPLTTERLLSMRVPGPDGLDAYRSGALALLLARVVAARHGGGLSITTDDAGWIVTLRLATRPPAASPRPPDRP